MTTLEKIQNLVDDTYTIEISSETEVHLDDYEEGELGYRNGWVNDRTLFHSEPFNVEGEIKQYLTSYIEDTLFLDYTEKDIISDLKNYDDNDYFCSNQCVDNENTTPSKEQIESWKKKEIELFNQSIRIEVSINGTNLTADILLEIMEKN